MNIYNNAVNYYHLFSGITNLCEENISIGGKKITNYYLLFDESSFIVNCLTLYDMIKVTSFNGSRPFSNLLQANKIIFKNIGYTSFNGMIGFDP